MSLNIKKKSALNHPSASLSGNNDACAVFGKDDKSKIDTSKILSGCNYNSHHLGIDKMVLLLPVEEEAVRQFIKHILVMYGKELGFKLLFSKQHKVSGKKPKLIYLRKWKSKLVPHFFLEIMPIFPGVPYARITLNPAKMGAEGVFTAKSQLNKLLPGGYNGIVQDAKVAYMEICYDVPAEKKSLSIYCDRVHSSPEYSPNKEDGTLYFGKKSSTVSFKCYNRKKKMERVEQEAVPETYLTRLEAMVKNIALKELAYMSTPFTRLHVFETAKLDIDAAVKDPANFKELMQSQNFFNAMKSLPHYRRQKALLHFASAVPGWWSPKATWQQQWVNLLEQYGLLSPYAEPLQGAA